MARFAKPLTPDKVKEILEENNTYQTMLDRVIDLINGYMRMPEWNSVNHIANYKIRLVNDDRINVWWKVVLWNHLGEAFSERLLQDIEKEYEKAGWIVTHKVEQFNIPSKSYNKTFRDYETNDTYYLYYELIFTKIS